MKDDATVPWRDIRASGFNAHVGPIRFARIDPSTWRSQLVIADKHLNVGGVCHGGVLLTLADVTMGAATFEATDSQPCATIQLDGHFVAAAKPGQTLDATARQVRAVSGLSFMECAIFAGARQVFRASGVWKSLNRQAPGP